MNHFARRLKGISVSFLVSLPLVNCAVTPHSEQLVYKPLQAKNTATVIDHRGSYVRELTAEEELQTRKVNVVGQVTLIDALRKQLPKVNIVPADTNVNLTQLLNVHARDMSALDFLRYLSSITGYDINYRNGVVTIHSFISKEWNLALFSSKRNVSLQVGKAFSADVSGAQNVFNGSFVDDEWAIIMEGAKRILGTSQTAKQGELAPYIQGVRSIGLVSAGGEPHKIRAVDNFITSVVSQGAKQINISVQAYEVTLDDQRGAGIDWKQLSSIGATVNGNDASMVFGSEEGLGGLTDKLFNNTVKYDSDKVSAEAVLSFLNTFGEVELLNQPNVTVRNGTYAYISAGEELTYIGEIELKEDNDGDDTTTVKVDAVRVGVTLSVAPRILPDGRVLLEIWPSISSADLTERGPNNIVLPKIDLQELATEVITENGRPVQLGGFIRRSIAKSLSDLPWQEKVTGKILNPMFRSETAALERTELVLTVTPTVVEGV